MLGRFLRRPDPLDTVMLCGLTIATIGFAWSLWPVPDVDPGYFPRLMRTAYNRRGALVMIDEGHWNLHTAGRRYQAFAQLLQRDGYRITSSNQEFVPELFRGVTVLVIANALGFKGRLQHIANHAGFGEKVRYQVDAFVPAEIEVVRDWVRAGGSLLLVADPVPFAEAARSMASAFGVQMSGWYVQDGGSSVPFEFGRGLIDHPVMRGRPDQQEDVSRVVTYTGQSLAASTGASPLLALSAKAREYPGPQASEMEARSAAGKFLAVALEFGRGRVVVLGDAAVLTAQLARNGGEDLRYGINDSQTDNQQFALNIVHWLSRLI
jgi:hypothetical protein